MPKKSIVLSALLAAISSLAQAESQFPPNLQLPLECDTDNVELNSLQFVRLLEEKSGQITGQIGDKSAEGSVTCNFSSPWVLRCKGVWNLSEVEKFDFTLRPLSSGGYFLTDFKRPMIYGGAVVSVLCQNLQHPAE